MVVEQGHCILMTSLWYRTLLYIPSFKSNNKKMTWYCCAIYEQHRCHSQTICDIHLRWNARARVCLIRSFSSLPCPISYAPETVRFRSQTQRFFVYGLHISWDQIIKSLHRNYLKNQKKKRKKKTTIYTYKPFIMCACVCELNSSILKRDKNTVFFFVWMYPKCALIVPMCRVGGFSVLYRTLA